VNYHYHWQFIAVAAIVNQVIQRSICCCQLAEQSVLRSLAIV